MAPALNPASRTLRVLAALLSYPDARLRDALDEMRDALRQDAVLSPARQSALGVLIDGLSRRDPLEVEADYVDLFDRGRTTSLHLFEHVHGDSRDRGPALLDLAGMYGAAGLQLRPGELPDYLPAVLEFASTQPAPQSRGFLAEISNIINVLHESLQRRSSAYASVPAALLELAGEPLRTVNVAAEPALDESWAEPEVFGGCSARGQQRPGEPQPVRFIRRNSQPGAAT